MANIGESASGITSGEPAYFQKPEKSIGSSLITFLLLPRSHRKVFKTVQNCSIRTPSELASPHPAGWLFARSADAVMLPSMNQISLQRLIVPLSLACGFYAQ